MAGPSIRNFASRAGEGLTDLRILEGIPDAVIVQDPSGRVVFANAAAAGALGISHAPSDPADVADAASRFQVFDESGTPIPPRPASAPRGIRARPGSRRGGP